MKIKVCGMKYLENIEAVAHCQPDFMGFIYYKKSPRYVGQVNKSFLTNMNKKTKTVAVFVNSPAKEVIEIATKYHFDFVQLHGDESIVYTQEIFNQNIKIIKAFQITEYFDWKTTAEYTPYVDYFLFDTPTKNHGGSGLKFDWSQLNLYKGETPFFLSGGLAISDIQEIKKLNISQLFAIDINSRFEIEPGLKDIKLIKIMINEIRNERIISSQ